MAKHPASIVKEVAGLDLVRLTATRGGSKATVMNEEIVIPSRRFPTAVVRTATGTGKLRSTSRKANGSIGCDWSVPAAIAATNSMVNAAPSSDITSHPAPLIPTRRLPLVACPATLLARAKSLFGVVAGSRTNPLA